MSKAIAFALVSLAVLGAAALGGAANSTVDAASGTAAAVYPNRPVTLVVTFPPGGGTDLLARRLAARLERSLGQTFVVENRAGASGNIGAQAVARSKPDGYTLLVVNSSYAINPGVYRNLGFSPETDLVGVINVAFVPSVLVTRADSPWRNLNQTLETDDGEASAAPLAYASCGNGTPQHLAGEMLIRRTGFAWLHVPYRGCGPALAGVLAGNVPVGFVTASSALPFLQSGALRALGVTSKERSPLLPNVPTIAEQGFTGYELDQWHGLLAPAGTPSVIIERLNAAIAAIMQSPDMVRDLRAMGYDTTVSTAQAFQALVQHDRVRFGELTRQMGLRAD